MPAGTPRPSVRPPARLGAISAQAALADDGNATLEAQDFRARVLYAGAIGARSNNQELIPVNFTGLVMYNSTPGTISAAVVDMYLGGVKSLSFYVDGFGDLQVLPRTGTNRFLGNVTNLWTNAYITNLVLTTLTLGTANQGDIFYDNGAALLTRLTPGTSSHVLKTQGAGANPVWALDPAIDLVTTKGDILAATAADVLARLGVGANDTVLTAASGEATGLKWAAVNVPTVDVITSDDTNVGTTPIASLLTFEIGANDRWAFKVVCYVVEGLDGFSSDFTVPASATGFRSSLLHDTLGELAAFDADMTTDQSFTTAQMSAASMVVIEGQVAGGGTAGTVTFRFAEQGVAVSNGATLKAGSYLIAQKLA